MKNFLLGVVMGALISMVNNWSFEDELKQQDLYCKMNSGGLWYDSAERYAKICHDEPSGRASPQNLSDQEMPRPSSAVKFIF